MASELRAYTPHVRHMPLKKSSSKSSAQLLHPSARFLQNVHPLLAVLVSFAQQLMLSIFYA